MLALGLALVAVDFRTAAPDLLPDVADWLCIVVGGPTPDHEPGRRGRRRECPSAVPPCPEELRYDLLGVGRAVLIAGTNIVGGAAIVLIAHRLTLIEIESATDRSIRRYSQLIITAIPAVWVAPFVVLSDGRSSRPSGPHRIPDPGPGSLSHRLRRVGLMDIQTALALLQQSQPAPAPPLGPPPPAPPLSGRALRFVLLDELLRRREMTVAEMVTVVAHQHGFHLSGRASKVISDALRWEIRRGRVVRLGRGRYRFARTSRATARRVGILAGRCRAWIVATRRQETPPATPRPLRPTTRPTWRYHPGAAPWDNLAWLRDV